jgi:hypothetical protein
MMPSKFKLTTNYDTSYTSPFLVKIDSPIMCFHHHSFKRCQATPIDLVINYPIFILMFPQFG